MSRVVLLCVRALLAFVGLVGVYSSSAMATSYLFTFSGGSGANAIAGSIVLNVTGNTITSVSNGTGLLAGGTETSYTQASNGLSYGATPQLLSTSTKPYFTDGGGVTNAATNTNFVIKVGSTYYKFYSGSGQDHVREYTASVVNSVPTGTFNGTDIVLTAESIPSPTPGSGWLSWSILLAVGLYTCRSKLRGFGRAAFAGDWRSGSKGTAMLQRPFSAT